MLTHKFKLRHQLENSSIKNYPVLSAVYILFLLLLFLGSVIAQINNFILTNSLDTSWMFTLNYASSNDFIFGRDIVFTFGPLGFLGYPVTEGLTTTLLIISYVIKSIFFLYTGLVLYELYEATKFIKSKELAQLTKYVLLPWLVIKMGFYVDYTIFIFIALIHSTILVLANLNKPHLLLYTRPEVKIIFIVFNAVTASILLFLKISFFPFVIAAVFLLVVSFALSRKYVEMLTYLFFLLVTFVIIYSSFNVDLKGYVVNSFEIISGYKKSMQLFEESDYGKNFLMAIVITIIFVILLYKIKDELFSYEQLAKLFIILLAFYYCFSYSFTRGSSSLFFKCSIVSVIVFMSMYLTKSNEAKNKIYTLIIFILSFGFFSYFYTDLYFLTNWNHEAYRYMEKIPKKFLDKSKTYDVYPYQTSLAYFNQLKYKPRPVFQSYSSYTPTLDQINANFFSKRKVDNVIFHTSQTNSLWGNTIDDRYFLFEEPLTKIEILKNYTIKYKVNESIFIAEQRKKAVNVTVKLINTKSSALGSLIDLEAMDSTKLYFFTADFKYSSKAKIASVVYKFPYIRVELTTTDNETMTFNTVSDLLSHYCILNKYCSNYYDYFSLFQRDEFKLLKNVKSIRFMSNQKGYLNNFDFKIYEVTLI